MSSPLQLRIVRGDPSAEEIAIAVAVLAARAAAPVAAVEAEPVSAWRNRESGVRRPLAPGPGAWRASGRPGAR